MFTGWTGSNGEEPQLKVTITGGSTGALHFYANYLYNGRETEPDAFSSSENEDKIWAYEGDLYVKTSRPGSVVRIYTAAGVLQTVRTLLTTGETKIRLPFGVYVVTINNGVGRKAVIVD